MKIRVLLADDHALFREALRMMLETHPDLDVVAEVEDGLGIIAAASTHLPDVACIDVGMPGLGGIEATRQLVAAYPALKVVAISASADRSKVARMVDAGALAYVLKMEIGRQLPIAIRRANQNLRYFSPELEIADSDELMGEGFW